MRLSAFVFAGLPIFAALTGCAGPAHDPDAVATFRDGSISLAEVEQRVRQSGAEEAEPDWPARYREAAEALTLEHALLEPLEDRTAAFEGLGEDYLRLVRQATLALYLQSRFAADIQVDDEEIRGFYEAHPEIFRRPERRFAWHIFRRYDDPEHPQPTLDFLAELRRRALGGEPFMLLAREYSHSETRLLDGRLGWLGRGRLPKALEEIVFGLEEGGVSEPLKTSGGALLMHVSSVVPNQTFELEDARLAITRRLRAVAFQAALHDLIEEPAPEGATILEPAALRERLAEGDPEATVLEIGDFRLDASELRDLVADLPPQPLPFLTPIERVEEVYRQQVDRQLLYLQAIASGFTEAPEAQRAIDEQVERQAERLWVDGQLRQRMMAKIEMADLASFFEDNRLLYQSPLRLKISALAVPIGSSPRARLAEMERLHTELVAGRLDLEAAALEVWGKVVDIGWAGPEELAEMEPKARAYLLQLGGVGFTQPFQLNRLLQIQHVDEWQEPRSLPFEEVVDRVREDYFDRNQQALYATTQAEILASVDFRYRDEVARRRLEAEPPG